MKKRDSRAMRTPYYLAYGSNLHRESMAFRCPAAKKVRAVNWHDWALVFRGVADVEPRPGAVVRGAIYKITPACLAALDRYEGYPRLYVREYFEADLGEGPVEVMFYRMRSRETAPPNAGYLNTILDGLAQWGHDDAECWAAVDEAWTTERLSSGHCAGEACMSGSCECECGTCNGGSGDWAALDCPLGREALGQGRLFPRGGRAG